VKDIAGERARRDGDAIVNGMTILRLLTQVPGVVVFEPRNEPQDEPQDEPWVAQVGCQSRNPCRQRGKSEFGPRDWLSKLHQPKRASV
jgi:hypothetical protein